MKLEGIKKLANIAEELEVISTNEVSALVRRGSLGANRVFSTHQNFNGRT